MTPHSLTVGDVGESGLLRRVAALVDSPSPGTLGIGDDAAVLARPRSSMLFTTDSMVEGTHFTRDWFRPEELGFKALAANLSDAAAMGGRPTDALVSLVLPAEVAVRAVERFYRGMGRLARRERVRIVGGNIARGEGIAVTISLLGDFPRGKPFLRAGARPGDRLFVSGRPGLAYLGYRLLAGKRPVVGTAEQGRAPSTNSGTSWASPVRRPASGDPWNPPPRHAPAWRDTVARSVPGARRAVARFLKPEPRLALSRELRSVHPTAVIDVSDGLGTDLIHLAEAGAGLMVEEEQLPVSFPFRKLAEMLGESELGAILHGGEDYELLFAIAPRDARRIGRRTMLGGVPITEIGTVIAEKGHVLLRRDGRTRRLPRTGFRHFTRG